MGSGGGGAFLAAGFLAAGLATGLGAGAAAGAAAGVVTATAAELAELAELRSQRDEMMSILEGYQGTVQKLSDEYSADACAWTSENRLLKTEVERLRREQPPRLSDQHWMGSLSVGYTRLLQEVEPLRRVKMYVPFANPLRSIVLRVADTT